MRWTLGMFALSLMGLLALGLVLIRVGVHWWRRGPDSTLKIPVRPQAVGLYDESKAVAGYRKAQRHSSTGRLLPQPKKVAEPKKAPGVSILEKRRR